jgi:hypothetical protein
VGTGLRITVGLLLIAAALIFDQPSRGIGWWDVAGALIVLPLLALGAAWLVNAAYRRRPAMARRARIPWSAAQSGAAAIVISAVVASATALTFVTPVDRIAIFLFFGASMVLAAVRGYDGCEILALPNTILRRSDAVWCPIYSPIDSAERRPDKQPVQLNQKGAGDADLRQPR